MPKQPMLDDLELEQVQEVTSYERRILPEYKPPGMAGSLMQNLGRRPMRMVLWGVAIGPQARDFTEKLDAKFRAQAPVPFTADISADAKLDRVLIDDLRLQELGGRPERFAYVLALREFIKPKEPEDTSAVDTSILDDASKLADGLVNGLAAGAALVSQLQPFVDKFGGFLTRLQSFKNTLPK